ncbi:inositol monophosphatase family protein [Actinosynnema sp. NPDC047251]|uniref:Inositol-1-monophosphatase n=1 Tax=Saccharothrix espanaensis (strain ATCC 51144 / DSM 44229 / JCM 9112 / NBRC 15066 / NRRL 15764) TaxID=1179773 RepID=K0JTB5_SACES|nr:inositol monophosphatase family protein [Saccharothrix espanaensis]CCH29116.1 Inositol-phosphate phosphatase [Saccharothrix espanaensis DSM 44229]
MQFDPRALVDVAVQVGREAGDLVQTMRSSAVSEVDTKSTVTDVVTAADRASEQLVRRRLAELRPGEPVIGEEEGGDAVDGLTWVVDPIDGTVNYLYGIPHYAVSIAAQVDGVSVAAAVVEPDSGRVWTAATGAGAWLDGRRLTVSRATRLDVSLLGYGFAYRADRRKRQAETWAGLADLLRDIRRAGAASLDLCAVAAGRLDAYAEHALGRWDWAAGGLLAREAGAVVHLPGAAPELGADATFAAAPGIADALFDALVTHGFGKV